VSLNFEDDFFLSFVGEDSSFKGGIVIFKGGFSLYVVGAFMKEINDKCANSMTLD
jgi:hypothetical protein